MSSVPLEDGGGHWILELGMNSARALNAEQFSSPNIHILEVRLMSSDPNVFLQIGTQVQSH